LYIPSTLAYGPQSKGEIIKANENLVFDIEVVDALTLAQANAEMEVLQKKKEADQKRQIDSARNAQKLQDTSKNK
jgi:hypothetical protein